ncbi:type II toxin-antitoxin system RelE/ParE family toxin [uncultured Chitinophaga sp.]|uniref:type II toxin-antitoxin system RelE/ParE family toxin n=2 Tax=Chitinophaga TaxID=79328 RepID=UPI00260B9407|nr:type II toxin-antitoxin system RelE/ParE family toxin [uncultured Chitinophaga sp.]
MELIKTKLLNPKNKLPQRTTFHIFMSASLKYRTAHFYKHYFEIFYEAQREEVKAKIIWTIKGIEAVERIPTSYVKHIEGTNGLYEMRIKFGTDIFRIFCFFDKGKLIILANGFQKKTQKTPVQEILKALKIKREYEDENK